MMPSDLYNDAINDGLNLTLVLTQPSSLSDGLQKHNNQTLNWAWVVSYVCCVFLKHFFIRFLCCCFQARANRGWSTSASTSASPATSACPSASTTYQSDCVLSSSPPSTRSGKQSCLFSSLYKKKKKQQKNPTEQKPALTVFLCAIQLPANQWSSQLSQSVLHLFRERRDGDRLSRLSPEPRRHSLHV